MNKTLMSIVLLLGFAVLVGLSVSSRAAESVGNVVDDTVITTTVKAELAKDVRLGTLTDIEVSTTQGVVTLAGKVHNFSSTVTSRSWAANPHDVLIAFSNSQKCSATGLAVLC